MKIRFLALVDRHRSYRDGSIGVIGIASPCEQARPMTLVVPHVWDGDPFGLIRVWAIPVFDLSDYAADYDGFGTLCLWDLQEGHQVHMRRDGATLQDGWAREGVDETGAPLDVVDSTGKIICG